MSTIFNPTDTYSTNNTSSTKNWWDMPTSSQLGSSSVAGYQLPDYGSFLSGQKSAAGNMFGNQNQQVGNWLSNYSGAINRQETLPAMYSRIGDELNIPGLRNNANTLTSTVEAIPETYGSATRGFDVNANQLDRIIGTKTAELAPMQQKAVGQLQNAETLAGQRMSLTQAQQAKELTPYDYEREFMADRMARETSMYSQQAQNELAALNNKTAAGMQLTKEELDRKQALELAKMQYDSALKVAQATASTKFAPSPVFNQTTGESFMYDSENNGWVPYVDDG